MTFSSGKSLVVSCGRSCNQPLSSDRFENESFSNCPGKCKTTSDRLSGYQAGKLKLSQTGLIQTVFLRLIIHQNYLNTLFALQNIMMSLF